MKRDDVEPRRFIDPEIYKIALWEWFICTTAVLLHYEKYAELHDILTHTYFLTAESRSEEQSLSYPKAFYHWSHLMEEYLERQSPDPKLNTYLGDLTVKRERRPMITQASLTNADLVLYQISSLLGDNYYWFPMLYGYWDVYSRQTIWSRMVSKAHCRNIMPLFGVSTIDALKGLIGKSVFGRETRYSNSFREAISILDSIEFEKIGTLN
jgi:hypothetical protein